MLSGLKLDSLCATGKELRGFEIFEAFCHENTFQIKIIGPKHISLEVLNVEFDFDVSVCYCMLSTDTSKTNSRPYNSVQMSIPCKVFMYV